MVNMTYRELNSLWLNTTTIGKMMSEKGFNCGYIENLIYAPTTIIEHIHGTIDIKPEIVRNWDDEISDLDKKYLSMKMSKKFTSSLNW